METILKSKKQYHALYINPKTVTCFIIDALNGSSVVISDMIVYKAGNVTMRLSVCQKHIKKLALYGYLQYYISYKT